MNRNRSHFKKIGIIALALTMTFGVVSCVSSQKTPGRQVAGFWDDIAEIFKEWNAREIFNTSQPARPLTTTEIAERASSGRLKMTEAEILIDNDASFDTKINMIRRAKKSIRMTYYIYSDDDSSSVITQELIKKAQAGVKVYLLVDFITGYKNLDLFQMMAQEGQGNFDVRFYNFPTARIQADAIYMTLPCPQSSRPESDTCKKYKDRLLAKMDLSKPTFFSSLFLAGLYGKNAVPAKVALGLGGQLDPAQFKGDQEMSKEDQAQLLEFLKLYFEAKVKKDIGAMIKVTIAMMMHGEDLDPVVNELTGRIPITNQLDGKPGQKISHAQEWDHITDYTHHKLLAIDASEFQLGGRNIEDSYHMKSRIPPQPGMAPKGKYIFMDTDFRLVTALGGTAAVEKSFDRTFNFREMVASLETVQKIMSADLIMNNEALGHVAFTCTELAKAGKLSQSLEQCVQTNFKSHEKFVSTKTRVEAAKAAMNYSVENYNKNYVAAGKKVLAENVRNLNWSEKVGHLSANDLKTAEVYYIENTSFNVKSGQKIRRTGSKIGGEKFFNKNIHYLWYRGLENACHVSAKNKKDVRVVLNSAYLFMPSGLIHKIAKMLNGDYGDCSRVHLTLLTNSFETTDLNIINFFARYQLNQLFARYQGLVDYAQRYNEKRFFPRLDYFEYQASAVGVGVSLHTKLSLIGDDMIIGSANADTRSYAMDTNNAVFIRNAYDLNRDYAQYIEKIISNEKLTKEGGKAFAYLQEEQIREQNNYILGALICRWDKKSSCHNPNDKSTPVIIKATDIRKSRFSKERIEDLLATFDRIGKKINQDTYRILNFRSEFDLVKSYQGGTSEESTVEYQMNEVANEFDDMFKLL